jgi:hypothetical protein
MLNQRMIEEVEIGSEGPANKLVPCSLQYPESHAGEVGGKKKALACVGISTRLRSERDPVFKRHVPRMPHLGFIVSSSNERFFSG